MSTGKETRPRDTWRGVKLVAAREIGASFDSGIAYVTTIAFALLANSIFMNEFFLTGTVDMSGFFEMLPLLLAFFLPALSMRLWAEERRQRMLDAQRARIDQVQLSIRPFVRSFVRSASKSKKRKPKWQK